MIFAASNEGIQCFLYFGPVSPILIVKQFVQEMTKSSQWIRMPARNLLLSQTQGFLDNHLDQISITLNQLGLFELREVVFAIAGAKHMNTSSYELSNLGDIDFFWENSQVGLDL